MLSDADVDQAVNAAIFGKFIHQGQICMIINRMIIHKDKYDEFVDKFVIRERALPYGDPSDPKTVIGPLINERQLEKALTFIEKAKQEGAELVLEDAPNVPFGGNKASGLGRFGNPWIVEEFTVTKWVSIQTRERKYPF